LPKAGPVQTGYEEKLLLYSLYKQGGCPLSSYLKPDCASLPQMRWLTRSATEGDISIPRPGLLDMLGRAKWDSWNKQKGKDKDEAKHDYVVDLLRVRLPAGSKDSRCSQGKNADER
jgi:acyl-CoA-binding protein